MGRRRSMAGVPREPTLSAVQLLSRSIVDLLSYIPFIAFPLLVWGPELGSDAQQRLLGVGCANDVVETVVEAGLCVAVVAFWRILSPCFGDLSVRRMHDTLVGKTPSPSQCFPGCFV